MDAFELHFCEKGTDYSFQIELPLNATMSQLWEKITFECLIPISSFTILTESERPFLIQKSDLQRTVAHFSNVFENGGVLTYYDARFEPITPQEEEYMKKLGASSNVGEIAFHRPPLFQAIVKKHPNIYDKLQPPLSLLYVPNEKKQLPLRSLEFIALLSQTTCTPQHRKQFWTHWVEKKTSFLQSGGILLDNSSSNASTGNDSSNTMEISTEVAKFEVFSTATEKVAKNELRYIDGLDQIQAAYEYANEYTPEIFGDVIMLYIPFTINDHKVACFVDSGAQTTLISYEFACRVGIDHLIDKRFAGKAAGVGVGNILGLIHAMKVQLGSEFLSLSFKVVDSIKLDVLLGLDNLKRHQMNINCGKNCLEFNSKQIPFLSEGELNEYERTRIQAKVDRNEFLGLKPDHGFDPSDKAAYKKMQGKDKISGNAGKSVKDMVSFMMANHQVFSDALKPILERHEYQMMEHQRNGAAERPDAGLVKRLQAQNTLAINPSMMNDLRDRSPEELQRVLQLLAMLQQSSGGEPGQNPLANMTPDQLQQLLQSIPSGALGGGTTSTGASGGVQPDPVKVQQLIDMGFSKPAVQQALSMYGNDLDMALLQLQSEFDDDDSMDNQ